MPRRKSVTWDQLPLFASDEDIGEAVLGWDRWREFAGLAALHEPAGMPKIDPAWGGRYVPGVKQFLDSRYKLADIPSAPPGKEGSFHIERKRPSRRSFHTRDAQ